MTWIRTNLPTIALTILLAVVSALAGVRAELKRDIEKKADCQTVNREFDQLREQLTEIGRKLDQLLLRGVKP